MEVEKRSGLAMKRIDGWKVVGKAVDSSLIHKSMLSLNHQIFMECSDASGIFPVHDYREEGFS